MNKYHVSHKTFIAALDCFSSNMQKFKRYYNDKRLTVAEKAMLKSKVELRKSNFSKALELLEFTTTNPFLKANQLFLQGTIYNNSSASHMAIPLLKESYMRFLKLEDKEMAYNPLFALVITLINQRNITQVEFYLKELAKLNLRSPYRQSSFLRAKALYYSLIDNNQKALEEINKAMEIKSESLNQKIAFFLVAKFVILFKLKRFNECEQILSEYKDTSGFADSANYNFMRIMLSHFLHDSPIYAYEKHFKGVDELRFQVNVIKHLSVAETELAKMYWEKLQTINSILYQDNLVYTGDYGLFSACLAKHSRKNENKTLSFNLNELRGSNTQDKLYKVLTSNSKTHTKEELIKLIWDEEYSVENSQRFNRLLSRVKRKYNLNVRVRKGSYRVEESQDAS